MTDSTKHNAIKEKQPKSLLPLCATEMWERFGFYIIQGMLILLITNHFGFPDSKAILILGVYGALVYISPLIGGYFADNFLGFRYTVLLGACFQCLGYIFISTLNFNLMNWGLASVILGNGFLKPNIASYLGIFYKEDDARRHAGFTLYYMGMNTGSFIATLSAGFIQRAWGWHVCFGVAALGMIVGIIVFTFSSKRYEGKGLPDSEALVRVRPVKFILATASLCLVVAVVCFELLTHPNIGNRILLVIAALIAIYLVVLALRYHGQERRNLLALIWLIVFSVVFWAIFFQMFSVVNLFVERLVDRHMFGITWPPVAFISLESVFIVILGWPLSILWKYLHHKNKDPNLAYKFVLALLLSAGSMWFLTFAIHHPNAKFLVLPGYMVLFYFLVTLAEMLLSPNLLSAVTELAPRKTVGLMMGVQYMAIGFGSSITGLLGQIAAVPKTVVNIKAVEHIYSHAFNIYALIAVGTAALVLISAPFISRLINKSSHAA